MSLFKYVLEGAMNENVELTNAEKEFAKQHGLYDLEAHEWYSKIEEVYGKGKVPFNIDLGYEEDEKGRKIGKFEGPDGAEHSFLPKIDSNVCAFAEKHGFSYDEAKVWYIEMEKVCGKGNVPLDAELGYVLENDGKKVYQFKGPDGKEYHIDETVIRDDVHGALSAQRKISDMKHVDLEGGDSRFDKKPEHAVNRDAKDMARRDEVER